MPRTATCSAILLLTAANACLAEVQFNRDIRPILTKHCTACHGGVKAAGNLSFVYREKALGEGKSGKIAIVPGQPDVSEMIRRITTEDEDDLMPKPEHGPRLSDAEVATLKQWITEGAKWSEHWSLVLPAEPAAPALKNAAWMQQPLDAFVLAKLEAEGLSPAPPASPAEWLRRVSLDLTGLPPSPEEWEAFQKEPSREKAVDRLLASPAFGEHWTAMWLDLARYSDTFGFEKDPHRDIWPWRDWVIRALNADMPFDQFTIKQLAGDLLPDATDDDILATAFHRNTQNNTEGGTDDEEWRTAAVHDRVNTTWTVWQATTFGCIQCHAHPYDPYPHADYYRFKAFFDSTEDCDQNDDWPRFKAGGKSAPLYRRARELRDQAHAAGLAAASQIKDWQPAKPTAVKASGGELSIAENSRVMASGTMPVGVTYTISLAATEGQTALRLHLHPDKDDPKEWPERGVMITEFSAALVKPDGSKAPVQLREVIADQLSGPFNPLALAGGGDHAGFGGFPVLEGPRWCVFVFDQPLSAGTLEVTLKHGAPVNSGFQGTPTRQCSFELSRADFASPERAKLLADWRAAQNEYNKSGGTAVPVLAERTTVPRDTRLYLRGNRLTKDESTPPALPGVFSPPAAKTRLEMAHWIVSDKNPLTARVTANRLWAAMFGHGIVETLEDFGSSGALPSNQALLDHLALRLSKHHGWSLKKLLREIALSATYAQTSKAPPELAARDPYNTLLARGPRQRLTAEMVRDHALAVSGLLSRKMHGPPVYPPQPDGIWRSVYNGESWKTSTGEDRYRRGLYTYSKRTAGYPGFLTFDAPSRDLCTARRMPTNTPLQALVTLNDPAFLEIAGALAKRAASTGGTPHEQIARAVKLITLEDAPAAIVESLAKLHAAALEDYRKRPDEAKKLADSPEAAALTLVANTLLNTDLALNR